MFKSNKSKCFVMVFEAIKAINHSKFDWEGYNSGSSLQPLKVDGPSEWSYGIQEKYFV